MKPSQELDSPSFCFFTSLPLILLSIPSNLLIWKVIKSFSVVTVIFPSLPSSSCAPIYTSLTPRHYLQRSNTEFTSSPMQ